MRTQQMKEGQQKNQILLSTGLFLHIFWLFSQMSMLLRILGQNPGLSHWYSELPTTINYARPSICHTEFCFLHKGLRTQQTKEGQQKNQISTYSHISKGSWPLTNAFNAFFTGLFTYSAGLVCTILHLFIFINSSIHFTAKLFETWVQWVGVCPDSVDFSAYY